MIPVTHPHPEDVHWMRRALALARSRAGGTWPNPTVGAALVRDGRLLAEGAHEGPGRQHAEIAALAALDRHEDAAGATMYVTLEPCHHEGRTPPCSLALAQAGVGRVVYAVADSNPRVRGGGGAWLRGEGIEVREGPLGGLAWELNHPFFETSGCGEAHVTLKLALSADGRLARRSGRVDDPSERRVTGPVAHRRVHALRAASSAILVGRRTVESDRPRLTARSPRGQRSRALKPERQPRPVVLDPTLRLAPGLYPRDSLVFASTAIGVPSGLLDARPDIEVITTPASAEGLAWPPILATLHERGLGVLLVEGGARVATSLLADAPPHRLHLFLSPRLFGGDGPRFEGHQTVEERYTTYRTRRVGEDVEWILRRRDLPAPPDATRSMAGAPPGSTGPL